MAHAYCFRLRGAFMYDDIISNIAYSLVFDFNSVNESIFTFCHLHGMAFSAILGFALGVKFLKKSFDL